ncbi:subtilisin-like protease [Salvia miltiorrhiza]|uniref:subtilisin-like protease n=1 Tax=Salvia miltiorrhiza TaxID=226208 RepID=UPI0025AD375D|nr:subtilisin-like protease [Salvia miltiorrhiza]
MSFAVSFLLLFCIFNFEQFVRAETDLATYIVHIDPQIDDQHSFLATAVTDEEPRILHHYRHVFSGFAARLSADEAKAIEGKDGFVSARRERVYELDTTHTPDFMGLHQNTGFWKASTYGRGVIIGMIDSGITPGHPSFDDEGVPPPPAKWKGDCGFKSAACNNKLIGARTFDAGSETAADEIGHGTVTASTAGGNFVSGASILGSANGTAAGIAPLAHVAVYRVCGPKAGCPESDVLAGIDAAIADGVDVISMSISHPPSPFHSDNIQVGAFRAVAKGIFISCSVGNTGPDAWTAKNGAPWVLTVGASTIDRRLAATVVLGDGQRLAGQAAFQPRNFPSTDLELVYPGVSPFGSSICDVSAFKKVNVSGKIVLCSASKPAGKAAKNAGAAAFISMQSKASGYTLTLGGDDEHFLPSSQISYAEALKIESYMTNASKPTAKIVFEGTQIGDPHAPFVASFSSRGPSSVSPGILKPDIIGPGSNILAAWPTSLDEDEANKFYMGSGTSISCPHLSGVAALLKSAHPDWSPAAIKSAIMTTADRANLGGQPIEDQTHVAADIFAIGAGHVNPSRATDPGLVYDLQPEDYVPYLCGLNYSSLQVGIIVQRKVDCSTTTSIPEAQLNYPSFSINLGSSSPSSQTYTRTVTNVGESNSSYIVEIVSPRGVSVSINPTKLIFSKVGQKLSYSVTFNRLATAAERGTSQGLLRWISAEHYVSSPIAVIFGSI